MMPLDQIHLARLRVARLEERPIPGDGIEKRDQGQSISGFSRCFECLEFNSVRQAHDLWRIVLYADLGGALSAGTAF